MACARLALLGALALAACQGGVGPARRPPGAPARPAPSDEAPAMAAAGGEDAEEPGDDARFTWQDATRSPRTAAPTGPLAALCPATDAALVEVARGLAERQATLGAALDSARVSFALRAAGSPYVWPRVWSIEGPGLATAEVQERARAWLESFREGGARRCGFARLTAADGRVVMTGVAVDALADLDPLPTQVRVGGWLTVRARLLEPGDGAEVVVLGPTGRPHTVTSTLDGDQVRATFSADRAGEWLVQVVVRGATGPRPVAEALIYAGEAPPQTFHARAAPGEAAGAGAADLPTALAAMVDAARRSEGLAALPRDPRLDRLAERHARAMRAARRLGHDLGDGDPAARAAAAGLALRLLGENVAHARSVRRAHRALWASPSHRGNLLEPRFRALGVGVARDPDGSVWVCELFAVPR